MSSPEKSNVNKDDNVVLEGDDNMVPEPEDPAQEHNSPSSNGDPPSGLSDNLSNESSDDDAPNTDCSSKNILRSPDALKRESALISGEQSEPETSPSPTKKAKNIVEKESASLDSGASTSKTKNDPTSPAATELPPSIPDPKAGPFTLTNAPSTPEKRDVRKKAITPTPVLKGLLSMNTPPTPPESPRGHASTSRGGHNPMAQSVSGRLLASLSSSGTTQPSVLRDILAKPPIISPHTSASANAGSVFNPNEEKKQTASQIQKECPLLTNLLTRGKQSSSSTQGSVSLNIPSETSSQSSVAEPTNKLLSGLSTETENVPDLEKDDYSEEETSSDELSSQSSAHGTPEHKNKSPEVGESPGMEQNIEMIERMCDIRPLSPLEPIPEILNANQGGEAPEGMHSIQVDEGNLSSRPSSSTASASEPIEQLSVQLSDAKTDVAKDSGDANISGQAVGSESKLSSQTLTDALEPAFVPSSELDDTKPISSRMSSQSSSTPSNTISSAPVSAIDDNSIESLGTESEVSSQPTSSMDISPETSRYPMDEEDSSSRSSRSMDYNLESIKSEVSSKTDTQSRKSKRLQETKSNESKAAQSAPEVPLAVNPKDEVFKKPSVTPSRLQTMKNRLEGIKLEETSSTDSPTRRSARIQLKESGSKDATTFEKGKNLRPKPGTSAASNEKTKESEKSKSLSRERVSKLKTEAHASRSASLERAKTKGKTSQTRSIEGTPASTTKPRKKGSSRTGSRERTSSEETVAGRTRSTVKSRLTSTSSNSETDRVEEDENMAGRTRSTIKARLASTSSNSETDKKEEDQNGGDRAKRKSRKDSSK